MPSALQLRVRGTVTSAICRTTTSGEPLVEVELTDDSGQQVRARHLYNSAGPVTHMAANSLVKRLRGQVAELYAINPKLRAKRIDCEAQHITLPYEQTSDRKDLE